MDKCCNCLQVETWMNFPPHTWYTEMETQNPPGMQMDPEPKNNYFPRPGKFCPAANIRLHDLEVPQFLLVDAYALARRAVAYATDTCGMY